MRIIVSIFFFFSFVYCNSQMSSLHSNLDSSQDSILKKKPEYFDLQWKQGTVLLKKETGILIETDSISNHAIEVLIDENQLPVLYTSKISTPVCADGECKLMHIDMYWTLLGDYTGFNRYKALPLTKHDHDEFLDHDYLKLHQLLIDDNSILKRRTINELVEKPKPTNLNDVDALSGATIAEVKETVVSGALYSCYTAWHLAHGDIKTKLKNYTKSILNSSMLLAMLTSNNSNYQIFAINNLTLSQYKEHSNAVVKIFKTSTPLVRGVIIKRLSDIFSSMPELQMPFWSAFSTIDLNSRSLLLKHLNNASNQVFVMLSSNLDVMSKNQLKLFLNHLSNQDLSSEIIKNLTIFATSEKYSYSYLVEQFLNE